MWVCLYPIAFSVYIDIYISESAGGRNAKFDQVLYYFNLCLAIHSVDVSALHDRWVVEF